MHNDSQVTHHDVDRNKAAGLSKGLGDVVTLSEAQTSTNGCTCRRSDSGVESIDVERQVDGQVALRVGIVKSQLHDLSDTVLVNVVHGEALDFVLAENFLLWLVEVAETNVNAEMSLCKLGRTYICSGLRQGETHLLKGATSVPSRPSRKETGQPWRLPESVDAGVLMSA
jgi:hypothetical protein